MAVNAPARSIVSRMKRRLSIARACISGGSAGWDRSGVMRGIDTKLAFGPKTSKYFALQRACDGGADPTAAMVNPARPAMCPRRAPRGAVSARQASGRGLQT
jgi:hypothetical protein